MAEKFKGMGGHMTASLIHDIDVLYRIYDHKIESAWMQHGGEYNANKLAGERDAKIRKIAERLSERGYTYSMKHRPASALKPREAELSDELKNQIRKAVAAKMLRDYFLGKRAA